MVNHVSPSNRPHTPPPAAQAPTDNGIKQAQRRAAFSVFLNLILCVGKGIAGLWGNSASLTGDAIHSATDAVASLAALFGLWLAGKKHPSFPYGLYKAETMATLITAGVIILAGYEIGRQALLGTDQLPDVGLTFPVAMVSLLVSLVFGIYQLRTGRRLHSPALMADARDYLVDSLSTTVVVLSLGGAYFGLHLDRWGAGIVSIFVFWSGGQLLWQAARNLMDEAIERDVERKIIAWVEAHPRVASVEQCLSRKAGGRFIVDLDVVFQLRSLELAHRIGHELEKEIRARFPLVVMVGIRAHFEPKTFKGVAGNDQLTRFHP